MTLNTIVLQLESIIGRLESIMGRLDERGDAIEAAELEAIIAELRGTD